MRYAPGEAEGNPGVGRLWDVWRGGDYIGANKPSKRVTVQKARLWHPSTAQGRWGNLLFNQNQTPIELPNVESVEWSRATDQDAATCKIVLANTKVREGEVEDRNTLDLPGWYTFNRGDGAYNRWSYQRNEWHDVLLPNRVIRTFEGYGVDYSVPADADPNLMSTGVWLIDTVEIDSVERTITLECRDIGKIPVETLAYPPAIPRKHYPLAYLGTKDLEATYLQQQQWGAGAQYISAMMEGARHGIRISDYTDIVKHIWAICGLYWPVDATLRTQSGDVPFLPFRNETIVGSGGVFGFFESVGSAPAADLTPDQFDKRPLMDAIKRVQEVVQYAHFIDEDGGVVWRAPNIWTLGNFVTPLTENGAIRTGFIPELDERVNLTDVSVRIDDKNGRRKVIITTSDGRTGASVDGFEVNPIGLDRVSIWTDQNFATVEECGEMARIVALRQLFTQRTNDVSIPGCPMLGVDDQVRIFDRVVGESFVHYVTGVSSVNNAEGWDYTLKTHWLGETPHEPGQWALPYEAVMLQDTGHGASYHTQPYGVIPEEEP